MHSTNPPINIYHLIVRYVVMGHKPETNIFAMQNLEIRQQYDLVR